MRCAYRLCHEGLPHVLPHLGRQPAPLGFGLPNPNPKQRSRYLVGAEIGRGAYGTVFRGTCLQSGRAVAIKRLSLRPPKGWNGRGENPVRALVRAEVAILRELREARHIV